MAQAAGPVEAQPTHVGLDGGGVLLVLGLGIGVVEAQIAGAVIFFCDAEIEADRLGVADVQIAIGLGREAGRDATAMFAGDLVGVDDVTNEMGGGVIGFRVHERGQVMIVMGWDYRGVCHGSGVVERRAFYARRATRLIDVSVWWSRSPQDDAKTHRQRLEAVHSMSPVLQSAQFGFRHTTAQGCRVAPLIAAACLAWAKSSSRHVGAATPTAGGGHGTMRERRRRVR